MKPFNCSNATREMPGSSPAARVSFRCSTSASSLPRCSFHDHHGLQCGFCTPGMLMTALDFLNTVERPTEEQIRAAMSAVICRCTGYDGIVKAVAAAAKTE